MVGINYNQRASHAVPMIVSQGPLFYSKFLVKKGHNSKSIAFRVMSLVKQLHIKPSRYIKNEVSHHNLKHTN